MKMTLIQENKLTDPHDSGVLTTMQQSRTPDGKYKFETVDGKYSATGPTFSDTLNELQMLVAEKYRTGTY